MDTAQGHYELHHKVYGNGPLALLAFHGFGQEAAALVPLAQALPGCTVYSIDLFFHGQSHWHGPLGALGMAEWQALVEGFLQRQGIGRFALAGFSMGGRLALCTAMLLPQRVEGLLLLAPDGVRNSAWYSLATRHKPLNGLFRYLTSERTTMLHRAVGLLRRLHLLHPTLARIADSQMRTPELRARVYRTWMLYRHLQPDLPALAAALLAAQPGRQVPMLVLAGAHDRLIPPVYMRRLLRAMPWASLHVLPCGHGRVPTEAAQWLASHRPQWPG